HADWKRIQPVLLRRSLLLSSASALVAGLLLALLLREAAVLAPERPVVILTRIPDYTKENKGGFRQPNPPKAPINPHTPVIPREKDLPSPLDSVVTPAPGIFDPNLPATPGSIGFPGNAVVEKPAVDDRPDPYKFVALDEVPKEVYSPKPEYPELARQA